MSDRWAGLLIAEAIALMIALILPVTPSRTGRTWSPAEIVLDDPSYLAQVVGGFVMIHCIYVCLFVVWKVTSRGEAGP